MGIGNKKTIKEGESLRGATMAAIDTLDYDKVIEVARNMGYDPKKPTELEQYIDKISEMDLWDISKILFFGNNLAIRNNNADC
jgi:hypothetical protein